MRQITKTWSDARLRRTYDISPAHLLVIAPTMRELGGLRPSRLSGFGVAEVGLGHTAAETLREVFNARPPQILLSVGFGGALVPELKTGDIVISTRASSIQLASHYATMSAIHAEEAFETLTTAGMRVTKGAALTVPEPLLTRADKERQGKLTGASVVDMETFWIAQEAERAGIPVISVRTVLDEMDHDLPSMVADITADGGKREIYHALRAMRNPANMSSLVPLAVRARKAAGATKDAIQALLPLLTKDAAVRAVHR
jgi:adenosylhomocysteine nucleosidase